MLEYPDHTLLERIHRALRQECGLAVDPPGSAPLLVGLSGGPDSVCLVHALHALGVPLIIAHLDHALRPESVDEAQAVRRLAENMGVEAVVERQDAAAAAQAGGLSIEEAARNLRYRFLFEAARRGGAQAVAVAHTADDQAETFLMHLLRGAGLSGLRGMATRSLPNPWSETLPLVRPLLGVWREEVEAYLRLHRLHAVEDASNRDWRYYRNRLRGEALPYLETLNPGVRARFFQTAALLRDDDEVIEAAAADAWRVCLAGEVPGALALDAGRMRALPVALQRRLLRRAAAALHPGLRDVDFAAIQRALAFLASPARSGQADWIAGMRLELDGERLWLADAGALLPGAGWPQLPPGARLELRIPGEVALPDGWRLRANALPLTAELRAQIEANHDANRAWLDRDALPQTLLVRPRRPGERFRPLGMGGHSLKLSDFMINAGLPRRARPGWPLAVAGDEVAWVPGYRLAQPFAVGQVTRRVVALTLSPPSTPSLQKRA